MNYWSIILPSHFTLRAPTTPGTITRIGKPWSRFKGSPFISYANITSPLGSIAFSIGIDAPYGLFVGSVSNPSNYNNDCHESLQYITNQSLKLFVYTV